MRGLHALAIGLVLAVGGGMQVDASAADPAWSEAAAVPGMTFNQYCARATGDGIQIGSYPSSSIYPQPSLSVGRESSGDWEPERSAPFPVCSSTYLTDADGLTTAIVATGNGFGLATQLPDHSWGAAIVPQALTSCSVDSDRSPNALIARDGTLVVACSHATTQTKIVERSPSGAWTTTTFGAGGLRAELSIARGRAGTVEAFWEEAVAFTIDAYRATRDATGAWGPPTRLFEWKTLWQTPGLVPPALATNASGEGVAVFSANESDIVPRTYTADITGAWTSQPTLDALNDHSGPVRNVGADDTGTLTIATEGPGADPLIRRTRGGTITTTPFTGSAWSFAALPTGEVVLIHPASLVSYGPLDVDLLENGEWLPTHRLPTSNAVTLPAILVGPEHDIVITYPASNTGPADARTWWTARLVSQPRLVALTMPGSVQAGHDVAVRVTPRQFGAALTAVWDFGDGSPSVTGNAVHHSFATAGDFTVRVSTTSPNGRSASESRVMHVDEQACDADTCLPATASETGACKGALIGETVAVGSRCNVDARSASPSR